MAHVILHTEDLSKRYGEVTAVSHLTLDVYAGEIFGFLGPNGAGKTTAINMMCGLLPPDTGTLPFRDSACTTMARAAARTWVGMCPQEIVIWERLTCLEQLQFVGQMYNLSARAARQRAQQLLQQLDLSEKQHKQARTLSGGMKRRLNIALALVHDPQIIVLDEPEAGLDPQSRVKVREFIQSLAHDKTIILTTHNMDEAERLADRIAITSGKRPSPHNWAGWRIRSGSIPRARCRVRALHAVGHLPAILAAITQVGLQPGEVRVRENSLEDVFIQLTGGGCANENLASHPQKLAEAVREPQLLLLTVDAAAHLSGYHQISYNTPCKRPSPFCCSTRTASALP
ncbi:MAG: ABC transporter ATP-binding protein [Chloroflexota bacterium]